MRESTLMQKLFLGPGSATEMERDYEAERVLVLVTEGLELT